MSQSAKEIHEALPNDNITVEAQQDRISLSGTVLSDASSEAAAKLAGLYTKTWSIRWW
jgi:osmotically-inducible protein OsmY